MAPYVRCLADEARALFMDVAPKTRHWATPNTLIPQFGKEFLFKTGGGANGLELRRSLWLEAGSVRQRRRVKTGLTAAPCTTIAAALLSPRCMKVSVKAWRSRPEFVLRAAAPMGLSYGARCG